MDDNRSQLTEKQDVENGSSSGTQNNREHLEIRRLGEVTELTYSDCENIEQATFLIESCEELRCTDKVFFLTIQLKDTFGSIDAQKLAQKCSKNSIVIFLESKTAKKFSILWKMKGLVAFYTFEHYWMAFSEMDRQVYKFIADFLVKSLTRQHLGIIPSRKNKERKILLNDLMDHRGFGLLLIAIEQKDTEMAEMMLNLGADTKSLDGKVTAQSLAWNVKSSEMLLLMAKSNLEFPKGIEPGELFEDFQTFYKETEDLHAAIKAKDTQQIENILKFCKHKLRYFFNLSNKSAARVAIEQDSPEIYEILLRHDIFLKEDGLLMKLSLAKQRKIRDLHTKYRKESEDNHINLLMTRSHASHDAIDAQENMKHVKKAYRLMAKNPLLNIILKVIAAVPRIEIIYDFNCDATHVDRTTNKYTDGISPLRGRVFIGAKHLLDDKKKFNTIGTIAHELCHFACQATFENESKPFAKNDDKTREWFEETSLKCKANKNKENIISAVYDHYDNDELLEELIVRAPQMLAHYFDQPEKQMECRETFPELFHFYETHLVPKMEEAIPEIAAKVELEMQKKEEEISKKSVEMKMMKAEIEEKEEELSKLKAKTPFNEFLQLESCMKLVEVTYSDCDNIEQTTSMIKSREELDSTEKVLFLTIQLDDIFGSIDTQNLALKFRKNSIVIFLESKTAKKFSILWKSMIDDSFYTFEHYSMAFDETDRKIYKYIADFLAKSLTERKLGFEPTNLKNKWSRKILLTDLMDERGFSLLLIAIEQNNTEMTKIMLSLGANTKSLDESVTAQSLAWNAKNLEMFLLMAKSNLEYPKDIEPGELSEELKTFYKETEDLHAAIKAKDTQQIENILKSSQNKLRYFFDLSNKSAAKVAIEQDTFEIYEILLKHDVHLAEDQILAELSKDKQPKIRDLHTKYKKESKDKHINILMNRSHVAHDALDAQGKMKYVRMAYELMAQNPHVNIILKLIAAVPECNIIYDFTRETTHVVDPTTDKQTDGICYFNGRIFIGAKHLLDDIEKFSTIGTIAHELCHFACKTVFENEMRPFTKEDDKTREWFEEISNRCERNQDKEKIVKLVYSCYKKHEFPEELIVRVPHMLAYYLNQPDKQKKCREIYPGLFHFYETHLMPKMEEAIPKIAARLEREKKEKEQELLRIKLEQSANVLFEKYRAMLIIKEDIGSINYLKVLAKAHENSQKAILEEFKSLLESGNAEADSAVEKELEEKISSYYEMRKRKDAEKNKLFLIASRHLSATADNIKALAEINKIKKIPYKDVSMTKISNDNLEDFEGLSNSLKDSIQKLKLDECAVKTCKTLIGPLKQLKDLTLNRCSVEPNSPVVPALQDLKSVTFERCNPQVYSMLKNQPELEKLRVIDHKWKSEFPHNEFNDLASSLPKFKHLITEGVGTAEYFETANFPYNIEKLDAYLTTSCWRNWKPRLEFFKSQIGSLKELTIHRLPYDFDGHEILKYIIEEMKLESFHYGEIPLILDGQKQDVKEFHAFEVNVNVTFEMFRQFPTIETFKLFLTETIPLDKVEIEKILSPRTDLFEKVRHLDIQDNSEIYEYLHLFRGLYKNCRNINKLTINSKCQRLNEVLKEILPELTKLNEIVLLTNQPNAVTRFQLVKMFGANVKKLSVNADFANDARKFFENDKIEIVEA